MNKFEPNRNAYVGIIKSKFLEIIRTSKVLDYKEKDNLCNEIGNNWHDPRFDVDFLVKEGTDWAYQKWKADQVELMDLWRQVVINSSNVSENPHEIANLVVKEFMSNFYDKNDEK